MKIYYMKVGSQYVSLDPRDGDFFLSEQAIHSYASEDIFADYEVADAKESFLGLEVEVWEAEVKNHRRVK